MGHVNVYFAIYIFFNFEDLSTKLGKEVWDIDPIILNLNVTENFKL